MKNQVKTILIGGTGRSGTNIIKEILATNSKVISLPFEHRFIIDPGGIIDFYNSFSTTWSPYMADKKIKQLEKFLLSLSKKRSTSNFLGTIIKKIDKNGKKIAPDSYHGWELNKWFPNYKEHVEGLISDLKTFEYSGYWPGTESYKINNKIYFSTYKDRHQLAPILSLFINNCINELLGKTKKEYFVEDNTWNILFAKELFDLMPSAKLLHILRDPRDVIASFTKQRWCPHNIYQVTQWYKEIIQKWFTIKPQLLSNQILEIKLEDFVSDTKSKLINICEFTGLPFEENMLVVKLNKAHSGRWRNDFSYQEQKFLNDSLSDILKILSYTL